MDEPLQTETSREVTRDLTRLDQALTQVRQALSGLRFGQIAITVQDGVVIQIERTERIRLARIAK